MLQIKIKTKQETETNRKKEKKLNKKKSCLDRWCFSDPLRLLFRGRVTEGSSRGLYNRVNDTQLRGGTAAVCAVPRTIDLRFKTDYRPTSGAGGGGCLKRIQL